MARLTAGKTAPIKDYMTADEYFAAAFKKKDYFIRGLTMKGNNYHDAEHVVLRVIQHNVKQAAKLDAKNFMGYMTQSCRFAMCNFCRQRFGRDNLVHKVALDLNDKSNALTPLEAMAADDECARINKLIDNLDSRSSTMVRMRIEGMTYDDIATVFNLSRQRVKQILVSALSVLQRRINGVIQLHHDEESHGE